jgi:DUF1009 family protein
VNGRPLAIVAGSGALPRMAAAAALREGRRPIVFALTGEADPAEFREVEVHPLRWGEVGRFLRLMKQNDCRDALLVGVNRRPDLRSIRPDLGALAFLPRIGKLMRGGDDNLLSGIAKMFAEEGINLVSVPEVAPDLVLPEGPVSRRRPDAGETEDIASAAQAVKVLGALDIGQAAVAIAGRVVAVEGAEGTDGLLARLAGLREGARIPPTGGVLVKCAKPQQDRRLDLPTIGPETARRACEAKLTGVAAEAEITLLVGREETIAAFDREGLFLVGIKDAPTASA